MVWGVSTDRLKRVSMFLADAHKDGKTFNK